MMGSVAVGLLFIVCVVGCLYGLRTSRLFVAVGVVAFALDAVTTAWHGDWLAAAMDAVIVLMFWRARGRLVRIESTTVEFRRPADTAWKRFVRDMDRLRGHATFIGFADGEAIVLTGSSRRVLLDAAARMSGWTWREEVAPGRVLTSEIISQAT